MDGLDSVPRSWFLLDAVHEAKLTSTALNRLAHALEPARDRAHVVITSRVTDWRPGADLEEAARWLPPPRAAADPAADAPVDVFLDEGADAIRRPQSGDAP